MKGAFKRYFSSTDKPNSEMAMYVSALENIERVDPSISKAIVQELEDQRSNLKLIASENFSSIAVQSAMGNLFTDKYAEGYPEHRFYAGCDNVDTIEEIACERACKLFGADHAFVQPHSGADANLIAYWAILYAKVIQPYLKEVTAGNVNTLSNVGFEHLRTMCHNQTLLGMDYYCGGHLTHGYRQNVSAQIFNVASYGVDKNGYIDYDDVRQIALEERPLILLAGYSAYPRKIDFKKMREIADEVGAVLMVDMAHFAGLVAGGVFTDEYNPVEWADIVTTTTHKTLRGPRGGMILCKEWLAEAVDKACPLVMGGPIPQNIASKAIALEEASSIEFKRYAKKIEKNAKSLAKYLKMNNIPLLTDGTDNHMVIIDLSDYGINGKQAELALRTCGITCNRNAIPNDKNGAWYTSGIRIGVPAVTTLGMGDKEMMEIARIITNVLCATRPAHTKSGDVSRVHIQIDPVVKENSIDRVKSLLNEFQLYPELDLEFLKEEFVY